MAGCADCIAACPHDALSYEAGGIALDAGACSGCGACAGICPARAITLDAPEPVTDGRRLIAVCARHPAARGHPAPVCINRAGLSDFAAWALAGIREIAIATGDCDTCPESTPRHLASMAGDFAPLARAHGLPGIEIVEAGAPDLKLWSRRAEDGPVPARRALLRAITAPLRDESAATPPLHSLQSRDSVFAFAPVIDANACSGCDACVNLCPEGVLTLINDSDGKMRYGTAAAACTGCLLCEDICADHAVEVSAMHPNPPEIALVEFSCRACGVSAHVPASGRRAASGLCPVCAASGHHKKLFQVFP